MSRGQAGRSRDRVTLTGIRRAIGGGWTRAESANRSPVARQRRTASARPSTRIRCARRDSVPRTDDPLLLRRARRSIPLSLSRSFFIPR